MGHMDHVSLPDRIDALEHRVRRSETRARWWRGIALAVLMLAVLGWALTPSVAKDQTPPNRRGLEQRVEALETKLAHVTSGPNDVTITGANLRIVNGLGTTETTNGLGNLIVGYNEPRQANVTCAPNLVSCAETRTGSHNIVVGKENNFSSFGGLVVGFQNEISGRFASITAGETNTASGDSSSISGGFQNKASGFGSSISGGGAGTASGFNASISGGDNNVASGQQAWVGGGDAHTASGAVAAVSGGISNTASGEGASVSGGFQNTASGAGSSVSGGGGRDLNTGNLASGDFASVTGGSNNVASGTDSSVSGGHNRIAPGRFNWAAGPLFADD